MRRLARHKATAKQAGARAALAVQEEVRSRVAWAVAVVMAAGGKSTAT